MYSVFIVDDEQVIVNEIVNTVPWMDNGFEVIGKETNVQRAIKEILEQKPHVIFTDLRMPYMDGHSFMRSIREAGIEAEFVMLSAYGSFEDARTFFMQEGFDYLLKPLQLEEVEIVLEKLAIRLTKKYPSKIEKGEEAVNPAFLELVEYLEKHSYDKLTLEQLGKKFGLSPGYICTLFAKYYSTTLTCYVTKMRMQKAVELIRDGTYTLKAVAVECGYKDYFYFNKVFKGYFGMPPSQYIESD